MWNIALIDQHGRGWSSWFYEECPAFKDFDCYIMLCYRDFLEKFGQCHPSKELAYNGFNNGVTHILMVENIGQVLVRWGLRPAEAERQYPYNLIHDRHIESTKVAKHNADLMRPNIIHDPRWFVHKH